MGSLHLVALNNMSPEETGGVSQSISRDRRGAASSSGRAFVDGRPVHVDDVRADPDYDPRTLEVLQRAAPLSDVSWAFPSCRDGVPIGAIGCGATPRSKPFTPARRSSS